MIFPLLLTALLYDAPKPDDQFKAIKPKSCEARVAGMQAACDVTKSVQECHDSIDVYYLFCGGEK